MRKALGSAIRYARTRVPLHRRATGVIHVGANTAQEAPKYARGRCPVVWIEPNTSLLTALRQRIAPYPDQQVIEALLSDDDGNRVAFHIADNGGHSSSMLDLKRHTEMFPDVGYDRTVMMTTRTLPGLLEEHGVDLGAYDTLVLDTQGAELLVLRGAEPIVRGFRYVMLEAPDFEAYAGCPLRHQLEDHMRARGFRLFAEKRFAAKRGVGSYYDLLFKGPGAARRP